MSSTEPAATESKQRSKDAKSSKSSGGMSLYALAEDAIEKLKILNYERSLLRAKAMQPLSKTYFAEPANNSSSQWSDLVTIVSWLMEQAGHDFTVDKWDDPTTSANKMMLSLKQLGFGLDFPVSKLKQAYGEAVCSVLHFLADLSLETRGFRWSVPEYPPGDVYEEAEVDEEADLGQSIEEIEEDIATEEDEVLYSEHLRGAYAPSHDMDESKHAVMENSTDPEFQAAWKTELERVGPKLKLKRIHAASGNEWRNHLEQTEKHEQCICNEAPSASKQLVKVSENLASSLERISQRERVLCNQFEHIAGKYRELQQKVGNIDERHKSASEVVEKLSNELAIVTDALDELKGNMDTRGNSMTDTMPLQRMRTGVSQLKKEIKQMELHIGVVAHTLLQAKLKKDKSMQRINGPEMEEDWIS